MLYSEVTASSLVKVNMQGETVEEGTTNFGVNQAGFMLHSAIHQARPDIKCIIHLHTPNIVAVSQVKAASMLLKEQQLFVRWVMGQCGCKMRGQTMECLELSALNINTATLFTLAAYTCYSKNFKIMDGSFC